MFEPLSSASLQIQIHFVSAIIAVCIGPIAIFRNRRDILHKTVGYVWVASMAVVAVSSFYIQTIRLIGPFGPIHILSIVSLYSLGIGVRFAIRGETIQHRKTMKSLYFWALGIAGLFTLMPGRIMGRTVFGDYQKQGFVAVMLCFLAGAVFVWRNRKTGNSN